MVRKITGGTAGRHFHVSQLVTVTDEKATIELHWKWEPSKTIPDGPEEHLWEPLKERKEEFEFPVVLKEGKWGVDVRFVVIKDKEVPEDIFCDAFSEAKNEIIGNVNAQFEMYSEEEADKILDSFTNRDWEDFIYHWNMREQATQEAHSSI